MIETDAERAVHDPALGDGVERKLHHLRPDDGARGGIQIHARIGIAPRQICEQSALRRLADRRAPYLENTPQASADMSSWPRDTRASCRRSATQRHRARTCGPPRSGKRLLAQPAPATGWLGRHLDSSCACATLPIAGVQLGDTPSQTLSTQSARTGLIGNPQLLERMDTESLQRIGAHGPANPQFAHLASRQTALEQAAREVQRARRGSGRRYDYAPTVAKLLCAASHVPR